MGPTIAELEARVTDARASEDPVAHVDALNALAWALRRDDDARAHRLSNQARQEARACGHTLGQARATRTMAMTIQDADGLRAIFDLAREALGLFDEAGDAYGQAGARDFLASLHEFIGDLAGGMEFALSALRIARELGDPVRQGYALSSVGGLLAASGELDAAVERLQEGLSLFESVGDNDGIQTMYSRLCSALKRAGRIDEARSLAERCVAEGDARDNRFLRWSGLTVMAEIAEDSGDRTEAERLYRAALDGWDDEVGRDLLCAETDVRVARLMRDRGASDEAEQVLSALLSRIEGNPVAGVAEGAVHDVLSEFKEARGDHAGALTHARRARALQSKVQQRDTKTKLAQVEVRAAVEAARRDAEIHKLRFVELHGMQAKLVEAEKMAVLGRLAAGAAHELNSPLGVLRSNQSVAATAVERLVALLPPDPETEAAARKLAGALASCQRTNSEALARLGSIAESFGRFAQLDQPERRRFDVREGIESALTLLTPTLPQGVVVERELAEVPKIEAWPRELNHAFLTVLQNAAQAIDGHGSIAVTTATRDGRVLLTVRDSGRGMSKEQVAHLFDVTWSDAGTRTKMRLGLSAAYATIQKHGGHIDVDSEPGQGTAITFSLPIDAPNLLAVPHPPARNSST